MMLKANEAEFQFCSAAMTDILRGMMMGRGVNVTRIIIWGENEPEFFRQWYDRILANRPDATPVSVIPWNNTPEVVFYATSATEACWMILRAIYLTVFPERPSFWSDEPIEILDERVTAYVNEHSGQIDKRVDHIGKCMNFAEWQRVVALAEVERATLQSVAHQWYDKRVQVGELQRMMESRNIPASKNTVTDRIKEWQAEGKIDRTGNGPMLLRMDLFNELNPNSNGKPQ